MMNQNYIEFGHSKAAHGIKGEVAIILHNQDDSTLRSGLEILLKPASKASSLSPEGELFTISNIRAGNKIILSLKGIGDRTELEKILPFAFFVDRNEFDELPSGEIYLVDLMGLEVFNEQGKSVGKIASTFNHGATDNIVINLNNGGELTLPFVDTFFKEVNIDEGRVVISDVEYL